jgi:DNA polymerase I-like protein with 3'-5' exonuclease and polymerase domains
MIHIHNDLIRMNRNRPIVAKLLLQIHDELLFEVRKENLQEVAKMIKHNMENAPTIPITDPTLDGKKYYTYTVIEQLKYVHQL